jgi:hypothetical protein
MVTVVTTIRCDQQAQTRLVEAEEVLTVGRERLQVHQQPTQGQQAPGLTREPATRHERLCRGRHTRAGGMSVRNSQRCSQNPFLVRELPPPSY